MAQRRLDRMSDDELFNDWVNGIRRIYDEMIALGQNRRMFRMMREVVERNQRLRNTGGHVIDWMFGNYAIAAGMSFRRDLDRDSSTVGLLNVLHEIESRPTVLNRGRYRAVWKVRADDQMERAACDMAFDSYEPLRVQGNPAADHVNPAVVKADRETLTGNTDRVRAFIEQTFAHRARGSAETVTWGEFNDSIEALVQVFMKYYALLTQSALVSVEPTAQYDTHECLTFPWWQPD